MKVLITGGAGFVGSNLCNYLESLQINYLAVDNLKFGYKENLINQDKLYINGFEDLGEDLLDSFDILVHLATYNIIYAIDDPIATFKNNSYETFRLFDRFKKKIIYTSTSSVYGQADIIPTSEYQPIRLSNAYDQSKYLAEMYLRKRGNYSILRLTNTYGTNQRADHPYSGVIGKFIGQANKKKQFTVNGNGLSTRDYVFVDDVVDAIYKAIESPPLNDVVNIGTGQETSIIRLIKIICDQMGIVMNMSYCDDRKIDTITRRGMDNMKAYKLLGWRPKVDIYQGIDKTIKVYNNKISKTIVY